VQTFYLLQEFYMNKFEQLIDLIINEETDKARALFHDIVVDKSRDIYESLMDDEDEEEVGGNGIDGLLDDITAEEEGMCEDDETLDQDQDGEYPSDDISEPAATGEEPASEEGLEDRVMDLEDALDELKAEFDALLADEEAEGHDIEGSTTSDEPESEFSFDADESDDEDALREYVEKVKVQDGEGKLVGSNGSTAVNDKPLVAKKNNMGGTAANIAKGGSESSPDGTKANAGKDNFYKKGRGDLPGAKSFKNVPGSNAKLDSVGRSYEKEKSGK